MVGDGGQSGFDVTVRKFRFHNFYDASTDVNFARGNMADWIWTADPSSDSLARSSKLLSSATR